MSSKLELPVNSEWPALLQALGTAGVIPRGLGRSYNDAAQLSGGSFIDTTIWNHVLSFEPTTGILNVEAGASLDHLMREFVPRGFFVPVSPGTRFVTIGGAIACDVHGKNHHKDGSFSDHVLSVTLATPSGVISLDRHENPELFYATCGGMGLTGVILSATIKLLRIETAYMKVDVTRVPNLDQLLELMEREDQNYRYSVAWVDSLARGASLGRAVLTRGDHAVIGDLDGTTHKPLLEFKPRTLFSAPDIFPPGLLNALSVKMFNELWYRKAPAKQTGAIIHSASFFHPLDVIDNWNRIYGRRGFVQYQYVVPFGQEQVVKGSLELLSKNRAGSFLSVLKRFGKANGGMLSFPIEGWTLALDLPVGSPQLPRLFDQLDDMVLEAGGRVYLAKDSRVAKKRLALMYPQLEQFRNIVNKVDPSRILRSDLSRRLGL